MEREHGEDCICVECDDDTSMDVVYEKGVPIPEKRRESAWFNIFEPLEVTDSVLVPGLEKRDRVSFALRRLKLEKGREFVTRKTNKGLRVWRTK